MPTPTLREYLKSVADAIREVEGSEDEIPALEFPDRIRRLSSSGGVDSSPLKTSLAVARSARETAKKEGDDDYDFGTVVTPREAVEALDAAIAEAQAVYDTYGTGPITQRQIDDAKAALDAALETFNSSAEPLDADTRGLETQEARLAELNSDVAESEDGKEVPFGSKWVKPSDKATAQSAIGTAQAAVGEATKQSQVDAAVQTLTSAIDDYEGEIVTASADTAALDAAIGAANAAKQDVQTSDDGGSELPAGSKYVTTEEMAAFDAAIQAATTAKTESTTQAQLDEAASTLTAATATFSEQVKTNFTPPADIKDASWADIEQLSALAAESPQDYQQYLGQTKVIDMSGLGNGCTNVTVMVIGVGHDVDPQGHKLGLTFQFRDGLPYQTFTMNSSNTTTGGWRDSLMRSTNLPKVKAAMPAELRSRLKTMVKKTHITNAFNALIETQDDLALLSQVEVFGDTDPNGWSLPAGEGTQYEWYAAHNTNNDRIIKRADGSAYYWWLRSVYDTSRFRVVYSDGTLSYYSASGQGLPCACFSV